MFHEGSIFKIYTFTKHMNKGVEYIRRQVTGSFLSENFHQFYSETTIIIIKGVLHPWTLFLKTLCIFSRNVPRNSKITVSLQ